jgi:iron-sulfur cluster assembly protein
MSEPILTLTPAAVSRVRHLLATRGEGARGLRVAVKPTGCSGFSYRLDFARAIGPEDRVVECEGVTVVVDPEAVPLVAGTEVDWVEDRLGAQFVFKNPNEKARCGCGESFKV